MLKKLCSYLYKKHIIILVFLFCLISYMFSDFTHVDKIITSNNYKSSSDYVNFSNLKVDNNKKIIDKVNYRTIASDIINSISTNGTITMYYGNGTQITNNTVNVGTGYKVKIKFSSSSQEYSISVKGDTNGDGNLSISDILNIKGIVVNSWVVSNIFRSASDYNEDNKINVVDMVGIANDIGSDSYADKINGYRCYYDNNFRTLYLITECQKENVLNARCKYKETSSSTMIPILRNNLSGASNCDGNIVGATGYSTSSKLYLKSSDSNSSNNIVALNAGSPFRILGTNSDDSWWKVSYNGNIGYVENSYMMINLPDYIPSLKFDMMNAKANMYTASGFKLSIYGRQLYDKGKVYNYRLEREEYMAPVVYSFAKKILQAQKNANSEGYGLKIYDAYRPVRDANTVRDSLAELYNSNATVRNGIDYSYENGKTVTWGQSWFIAQSLSSHSVGAAIDVVLVNKETGNEIPAQSSIHDLSTASVKYNTPVSGQTTVRTDLYSTKANQHTKDLDRIMLSTGMTNLASEWWHFQDNDVRSRIKNLESNGLNFQLTSVVSSKK